MPQTSIHRMPLSGHVRLNPRMDHVVGWLREPSRRLYRMLQGIPGFAAIRHVSLSVHEAATDMLWAFTVSDDGTGEVEVHEVDMADVPSLVLLADVAEPRIVDDLAEYGEASRFHSSDARDAGYRSCMTVPLRCDGLFLGFVMFGAAPPRFFDAAAQEVLETYSEAFAILVSRALDANALRPS